MAKKITFLIYLLYLSRVFAALPEWDTESAKHLSTNGFIAGDALLASKIDLGDNSPTPIPSPDSIPQLVRPLIIEPIPNRPENHQLPPVNDSRKLISQQLTQRYFNELIDEGIHDPQSLLSNKERVDTQYALERYAEESPVSIYFYLFDKNQRVPHYQSPQTTFQQFYYSEPSAVVVYYYMGEPERSQLYFGGKDANLVATNKIRDLTSGIRNGAKKRSNRSSQLSEFIKQLSLHMFWIEKSMIEDIYTPLDLDESPSKTSSNGSNGLSDKALKGVNQISHIWWIIAAVATGVIVMLLLGVHWVSSRKFFFPKIATQPRLSLPNGGSSGGILKFDKENMPPSAQKEQFHDPFK